MVTTVRRYDHGQALHCDPSRTDGVAMQVGPDGFLRADVRPARTGVQIYQDSDGNRWGELRTEDEVFSEESLRSFDLTTVTNDHPADFVNANNVRDVQVGTIGTGARRDGRFVRTSLVITDAETIRAVMDGKMQVSCGYTAQVISDSGVADDGTPFAGRQTNIRINHVAIVDKGRAGPECSVLARGDAFNIHTTHEVTMQTKTIKLGDSEYTVPEVVADALTNALLQAKKDADDTQPKKDAGAPPFGGKPEEEEESDKAKDKAKDSDSELRAQIDTLTARVRADAETFSARVDARARLVTSAVRILGDAARTDGVSDAEIMRAIVLDVLPGMKDKLDANAGNEGYLRACYDQAIDLHARRKDAVEDTNAAIFKAVSDGGKDVFTEALTAYATRGKAVN